LTQNAEITILLSHNGEEQGRVPKLLEGMPRRLSIVQLAIRRETSMTIQITKPEVEALINQRLQSGGYKDAEDVILQALRSSPAKPPAPLQPESVPSQKNLQEVFGAARGLADDIDFSRNPAAGRPVDLS
jgi:hypothetical protein